MMLFLLLLNAISLFKSINVKCYYSDANQQAQDSKIMTLLPKYKYKFTHGNKHYVAVSYKWSNLQYYLKLHGSEYGEPEILLAIRVYNNRQQTTYSINAIKDPDGMVVVNSQFKCHILEDFVTKLSCWMGTDGNRQYQQMEMRSNEYAKLLFDTYNIELVYNSLRVDCVKWQKYCKLSREIW
eukprot:NODE_682_length_4785_cov_0.471831.p4 type:complete len:182 gc:universal NODE_682_length_4785_cov_0.471831:100-645(+)